MKFNTLKANLQEAISIAQKAVTGKSTMPILEGILIKAYNNTLTLVGSDADLGIETSCSAEVFEEGSVVVDSKLFGEIIRKLPNDYIEVSTTSENIIEIKCQKSNFNLLYMDATEYPMLPEINKENNFSISQSVLKNMVKGTIFAVSQDESRPVLSGILTEITNQNLNMVALDGYRLALRTEFLENVEDISVIIPGKTLNEVSKILDKDDELVNISFTKNQILFSIGKTKVISRLLEGEFIKYNTILPKDFSTHIVVKKQELLNCVERASLLAKDGSSNLIKLNIEADNIIITSNSALGAVKEELTIFLNGQPLQIAFNSKYLIDVLKVMDEEEIIMEFSSSISPCIIKNKEAQNCTYLLLPVRVAK